MPPTRPYIHLHHVGVGFVTSPCLAVERLKVLSTPRPAAKPIITTRIDAKPERPVKSKIETKHEELPRPVEPKAAAKREEMPKTTAPKAVDRVVFQLVDDLRL
jgi:hypothetical protein